MGSLQCSLQRTDIRFGLGFEQSGNLRSDQTEYASMPYCMVKTLLIQPAKLIAIVIRKLGSVVNPYKAMTSHLGR